MQPARGGQARITATVSHRRTYIRDRAAVLCPAAAGSFGNKRSSCRTAAVHAPSLGARSRAAFTPRSWPKAASRWRSARSPAVPRSRWTSGYGSAGRLPEPVEISAYYLVGEALTNAAKHARASAVGIEAEVVGDLLRVTVRDNGVGGADLAGGSGLAGLKDRVEALGGRIVLHSPPRGGHHPARGAPPHRHQEASPPASPGPQDCPQ